MKVYQECLMKVCDKFQQVFRKSHKSSPGSKVYSLEKITVLGGWCGWMVGVDGWVVWFVGVDGWVVGGNGWIGWLVGVDGRVCNPILMLSCTKR